MLRFYPLEVIEIHRETKDAVVLTLLPREEDLYRFDFIHGQYLTFRRWFDGIELRRSYSICTGRGEGVLRVGIKRQHGGAFSTWANEALVQGEIVEAMPPMGGFHIPIDPDAARHYLGFAGGSGITPVLSIIKTVLASEPRARFTLVYANRRVSSIMFREELEDLKNLYLGRLAILHILEDEANDIELFTGRVDTAKCQALLTGWIDTSDIVAAFICGPEPMMLAIAGALRAHGIADHRIKFELFASGQSGTLPNRSILGQADASAPQSVCQAEVTLDGTTYGFSMPRSGQSLLDAALANSLDVPYACKAGVCSTCRARIIAGEAEMLTNHALEDYEVNRGYILTCQCYPLTEKLVVSYDQ